MGVNKCRVGEVAKLREVCGSLLQCVSHSEGPPEILISWIGLR